MYEIGLANMAAELAVRAWTILGTNHLELLLHELKLQLPGFKEPDTK